MWAFKLFPNVLQLCDCYGEFKTDKNKKTTIIKLKTMISNTKPYRNSAKLLLAVVLMTAFSCDDLKSKDLKSSKFELRQLFQETNVVKTTTGTFFLIAGGYDSNEEKITTVKVFAKVENRYRLIEMPIKEVRINIDNKISKPNIEIEYNNNEKLGDEILVNQKYFNKIYVINCPEIYLPEKLLPIGL